MKAGGAVKDVLGETARVYKVAGDSVDSIVDSLEVGSLEQPKERDRFGVVNLPFTNVGQTAYGGLPISGKVIAFWH
jgi:hypothetical protein